MPPTPTPPTSPEFRSLASTRDCLLASIADRKRNANPSPGHIAAMQQEAARLREVEEAMKRLDEKAFAALTAEKPATDKPQS